MVDKVPDLIFFCQNGHIVAATNEAEKLVEMNQIPPCICGANHLRALANWPTENTEIVPIEPIRTEKTWTGEEIDVFDISKLFGDDYKSPWDINWDELPPEILEAIKSF